MAPRERTDRPKPTLLSLAKNAINDLKQSKPEFSLDFAKKHLFYLKRPDQMKTYIDGLRKAGLT